VIWAKDPCGISPKTKTAPKATPKNPVNEFPARKIVAHAEKEKALPMIAL
tara:strand:- start:656 stop:805 length:150 start_codon:yes stop_codon:yes gene_type:complete